jgi:hypothetical protein
MNQASKRGRGFDLGQIESFMPTLDFENADQPETDVMMSKIFSPKKFAKNVFFSSKYF